MPSQQHADFNLYAAFTEHFPSCWDRKRGTLGPAQVLYTIMTMSVSSTHGYHRVLDYLKRTLGEQLGWGEGRPLPSSLSEARRKLSPECCKEAFVAMRGRMSLTTAAPRVRYGTYRILAVDMTTLALPPYPDVVRAFSCPVDNRGKVAKAPKATLTTLWDVSTNTPVDWRLERCYASERYAAYDLFDQLGPNDVLIADRGHSSRRSFIDLQVQDAKYLIRMPTGKAGGFREVHAFAEDDTRWDEIILLHEDREREGDPTLPVRFIKKMLASGEMAVFATNFFSQSEHSRESLCALYCHRWDIETAFREMKVWHGLESFHARFADGIHQEVAGLMIFMLLSAELEHQARAHHAALLATATVPADPHPDDQAQILEVPTIRFNRKLIVECVGHLLIAAAKGPEAFEQEYEYCMREIWKFRQRIRPGRSFPRVAKSPNSKWKRTTYNTKKSK
jgi:Transposase DDE domain/Insertion element 4 transposase N-terminal